MYSARFLLTCSERVATSQKVQDLCLHRTFSRVCSFAEGLEGEFLHRHWFSCAVCRVFVRDSGLAAASCYIAQVAGASIWCSVLLATTALFGETWIERVVDLSLTEGGGLHVCGRANFSACSVSIKCKILLCIGFGGRVLHQEP